jgi:sterol desaturase/sphingolipid hydroxylase (fatty acid hydroxylase superfamily)
MVISHPAIKPHTLLYSNDANYGTTYFIISIILSLIIHDFYFYWIHRWMHTKWSMKYVHRTHHLSTNPSPWAAFAFHPLEAVLEAGILIVLVFTLPLNFWSIMVFLIIMTIYNVYGHLGWEIYPKGFHKTMIGKWFNTSVSHNCHHLKFEGNYGLYTLIWDRIFGTIREDYDSEYDRVTTG